MKVKDEAKDKIDKNLELPDLKSWIKFIVNQIGSSRPFPMITSSLEPGQCKIRKILAKMTMSIVEIEITFFIIQNLWLGNHI